MLCELFLQVYPPLYTETHYQRCNKHPAHARMHHLSTHNCRAIEIWSTPRFHVSLCVNPQQIQAAHTRVCWLLFLLLFSVHGPRRDHAQIAHVSVCVCVCFSSIWMRNWMKQSKGSLHLKLSRQPPQLSRPCHQSQVIVMLFSLMNRLTLVISFWTGVQTLGDFLPRKNAGGESFQWMKMQPTGQARLNRLLEKRSHCRMWKGWSNTVWISLDHMSWILFSAPVSKGLCSFEDRNKPS